MLKDEHIFNSPNEAWQPDFTSPNQVIQNSFSSFFKLGFEHILKGLDHLAFLLGLVSLFKGKACCTRRASSPTCTRSARKWESNFF